LQAAAAEGAQLNLAVLTSGEAGTNGNGPTRKAEAGKAAEMLGAELQFLPSEGDTQIRANQQTTLISAKEIRRVRPHIVLAPSGHLNQHPDHRETSLLVRDANRLARYGKTPGLEELDPHRSQLLLFYDISSECSNADGWHSFLLDISNQVDSWKTLMECHASQIKSMDYIDLQLSRARMLGIQMGVHSALRLYSEGPVLLSSISDLDALSGQQF
jgi:LmbE family N-acetylglucosaminyl deacetylase